MALRRGVVRIRKAVPVVFDAARLEAATRTILDAIRCPDFDVDILLTDDRAIRRLNRRHRRIDRPTDILSYPSHPDIPRGALPYVIPKTNELFLELGSLVISVPYVHRRCLRDNRRTPSKDDNEDRGVSGAMARCRRVEDRLPLLVLHGLLHCLHFDHETEEDYEEMVALEERIIPLLQSEEPTPEGRQPRT